MARRHQAPCDRTSVRVDTSTTTKQSTTKTTISRTPPKEQANTEDACREVFDQYDLEA